MTEPTIAVAQTRFGLGARPDQNIDISPIEWLTDQIGGVDPLARTPPTSANCLALLNTYIVAPGGSQAKQNAANALLHAFASEQQEFMANAITTATPFRERMVRFWANHFALQSVNFAIGSVSGSFVREAIRPYVFDTYANLLQAAVLHPAILYSLDDVESVGYDSPAAVNSRKHGGQSLNINENLGRELLELFTVTPGANYTQADVDALANLLTGWRVRTVSPFGTTFSGNFHEPKGQILLGVNFPGTEVGTYSALEFLATRPRTYWNLAYKIVKHFVSDAPHNSDITTIFQALVSSKGNLAVASEALIGLGNAWIPLQKFRPPQELVIAALRGTGANTENIPAVVHTVANFGQPVWQPPFPNGWGDRFEDWLGPAQILLRASWCNAFGEYAKNYSPTAFAQTALAGLMSEDRIALCLQQEGTPKQLAMMTFSSEFQRR